MRRFVLTILVVVLLALLGQASEVQKLTLLNGSFEEPTITEAISRGSPGEGGRWATNFHIPGWSEISSSGFNTNMVVDGKQNFYWNDPQGAVLEQTLAEKVSSDTGIRYTVSYWRQIIISPGARSAGKKIQFHAELIVGNKIVDSETITSETFAIHRGKTKLTYISDGSRAGESITIRFRANTNRGWTNGNEIQSVYLDDVSAFIEEGNAVQDFWAIGLKNPSTPPSSGTHVNVFFPDPAYQMNFEPPGAKYFIEDTVEFGNEWTETNVNGEVFEVGFDSNALMWIERQNPARILVRFRGALVNLAGDIAHTKVKSGSPYGPGDWADEWYYVYPDGTSVRTVKIYTGMSNTAQAYWDRGGTGFETQETFIYGLVPGHQPSDDINIQAITLIHLNGEYRKISFKPYPQNMDLGHGASIQMVNLNRRYFPFTIVPAGDVDIKPYYGPPIDHQHTDQTIFVAWPRVPRFEDLYTAALTHVINWNWLEKTTNSLKQVYLLGLVKAATEGKRVQKLVDLAKSWQHAPSLTVNSIGIRSDGFTMTEKAYTLSLSSASSREFALTINASPDQPLVNPVFVVQNWGDGDAEISVDGAPLSPGTDFRQGFEPGKNGTVTKVIWLRLETKSPLRFQIRKL